MGQDDLQTTIGHHYEHVIPATKYGNLKYGAWGYNVSWTDEYRHSNCTITVRQRGTGTVPTVAVGWYYFTTNSWSDGLYHGRRPPGSHRAAASTVPYQFGIIVDEGRGIHVALG